MIDSLSNALLEPLSDENPCGPNLEYDSAFLTLERLATAAPERAIGDTVRQAEEPDWRAVMDEAERLAGRTRDVRVAIRLADAQLKINGLAAWAAGLGVVAGLLERYWDDVHPRIEDGDAVERVNALSALASGDGSLGHLRGVPLLAVERVGAFSLRDLRMLNGATKPDGPQQLPTVTRETVDAVVEHAEPHALAAADAALAGALNHVARIGALFDLHTPGVGPELAPLERDVREARAFLGPHITDTVVATECSSAPGVPQTDGAPAMSAGRGQVRNTADILRMLDDICAWYASHEPSSPVPALLRRASALVGLGFTDLLRALAPGGLSEFQALAGIVADD